MTSHVSHNAQSLVVARLICSIVAVVFTFTLTSRVEARENGQASARSSVVSGDAAHFVVARSRANKSSVIPKGSGDTLFSPAEVYGTGGAYAFAEAVADVNGDGKPDIIVTGFYSQTLGVLLGNGDGTFQKALITNLGWIPNSVAVADLNGDGKPDLIITSCCEANGDGQAAVMLGNGDGTFQAPVFYDSGAQGGGPLGVADLTENGIPDIIVVNWNNATGRIGVLLGNGDGSFQPALTSPSAIDPSCLAIADVNKDGKPDVVVCSENTIGVQLGNGDGTFQAVTNYPAGYCENTVAVADLNGDGHPDLLVGNAGPDDCSGQGFVGVLLGNGDGTFRTEVNYYTGNSGVGVIVARDVDLDGKIDAVSGTYNDATGLVSVLSGNGDGTFQSATTYSSGGSMPVGMAVTDLNGDGRPDIVAANFYDGTVGVLLNNIESPGSTTTTLTSSKNPGVYQQPVTFTASVTSASGTPTGTVVFYNGTAQVSSATLVNGSASYTTSSLKRGWAEMTAQYLGSGSFDPSTSAVLYEKVNKTGLFQTRIHLSSSNRDSYVGQAVTFTVTLSALRRGEIPQDGDQVQFFDDYSFIGYGTTQNGIASLTATLSAARHHTIGAYFPGDDDFGRAYTQITQLVNKYPTAVRLTASPNPALYGQAITFTATVTSAGPDTPTGEVRFVGLGTVTLVGGVATLTKSQLRAGTHAITAEYVGDDASAQSKSSVYDEVVNPASTTTTVTSSANPSSPGQSVTFTATVTSSTGLDPFGTVTFTAGGATLGTVALKDMVASVSTSALAKGTVTITATYNGSAGFTGSSASLEQTVQP